MRGPTAWARADKREHRVRSCIEIGDGEPAAVTRSRMHKSDRRLTGIGGAVRARRPSQECSGREGPKPVRTGDGDGARALASYLPDRWLQMVPLAPHVPARGATPPSGGRNRRALCVAERLRR
jgi:hypothetical protein